MRKKKMTGRAICDEIAHKLSIKKIGEAEILKLLHQIWGKAWIEGYNQRQLDLNLLKDINTKNLKEAWDEVFIIIEDTTHGGIRNKQE